MQDDSLPSILLISGDACTAPEVLDALSGRGVLIQAQSTEQARRILRSGRHVDVAICDREVSQLDCTDFIQFAHAAHPHVQCVMACLQMDFDKVIGVKNAVTSMSVVQLPWKSACLPLLVDELVRRSKNIAAVEKHLWASLVDEQRRVRATRMSMCYQALSALSGKGQGARLASYFLAALHSQEKEIPIELAGFDVWKVGASEAVRMSAVIAHVRTWTRRFEEGARLEDIGEVFTMVDGQVCVRDIASQLDVLNGSNAVTPAFESCCVLAYLLWKEPGQRLEELSPGVWGLVEQTAEATIPDGWLNAVLKRAAVA